GEYLSYGWEGGEKGYDFAADEQERARFSQELNHVLATGSPPAQWLTPSGERGAAAIGGIIHNNNRVLESGIVFNRSIIPNLPAEAAVEVPVMTDADGIHPISLGPLPDSIAKLLTMQVNVQQLAVEAAVHASKEIALQALLIDPVVNSAEAAGHILDELWEINRPYIRPCISGFDSPPDEHISSRSYFQSAFGRSHRRQPPEIFRRRRGSQKPMPRRISRYDWPGPCSPPDNRRHHRSQNRKSSCRSTRSRGHRHAAGHHSRIDCRIGIQRLCRGD